MPYSALTYQATSSSSLDGRSKASATERRRLCETCVLACMFTEQGPWVELHALFHVPFSELLRLTCFSWLFELDTHIFWDYKWRDRPAQCWKTLPMLLEPARSCRNLTQDGLFREWTEDLDVVSELYPFKDELQDTIRDLIFKWHPVEAAREWPSVRPDNN